MDSDNNIKLQPVRINPSTFANRGLGIQNGRQDAQNGGFGQILSEKINEGSKISFSKHAEKRLELRNINLTAAQMTRLEKGVAQAAQKGIKDSLVMLDDVYFVVNTKNKTVVTAVNNDGGENIFTNIDGAVIV